MTGFALYRGVIRRKCPAFHPSFCPPTNFLPFLSGSGEKRQAVAQIPLDGIWLGAAGIRSTECGYTKICTNKKQGGENPPCLKFLKVLRKPLLTGFALYRGVIRRERPAFHPSFCPPTNFLPFLSGSGEKGDSRPNPAGRDLVRSSRNSQHGIRLHTKSAQTKSKG